jgi:hypothetical protein
MVWLYGAGKAAGKRGFGQHHPARSGIASPHFGAREELSTLAQGWDGDCKVIKKWSKT